MNIIDMKMKKYIKDSIIHISKGNTKQVIYQKYYSYVYKLTNNYSVDYVIRLIRKIILDNCPFITQKEYKYIKELNIYLLRSCNGELWDILKHPSTD